MITQPRTAPAPARWVTFLTVVGVVQSIAAIEHVTRIVQVYVIGVAEGNAHGLLGSVVTIDGILAALHLGLEAGVIGDLAISVGALAVTYALALRAGRERCHPGHT